MRPSAPACPERQRQGAQDDGTPVRCRCFPGYSGPGAKGGPDIGLSADVIVGFPGRPRQTLRRLWTLSASRLKVTRSSSHPGRAPGVWPESARKRNGQAQQAVIALGKELSLDFHRKLIGREVEILVEDDRARDGKLQGFTRNYVRAWFDGPDELKGRIIAVRPYKATYEGLLCERVT